MTSHPGGEPRTREYTVRSGAAGSRRIPLSVFDTITGAVYIDRAFFFSERLDGEALRASLARVLRHYAPLAGRALREADGTPVLVCDDSGVPFTEETSESAMAQFDPGAPDRPGLKHLLPEAPPFKMTGPNVPTLAVKLTHPADGGSVLGVRMKHAVADGRAYVAFLSNWAREQRGLPCAEPCHDRALLDRLGGDRQEHAALRSERFVVPGRLRKFGLLLRIALGAKRITTVTVRFTAAQMSAMKQTAAKDLAHSGHWVSTNDALTAHVWKVLAELRNRPDSATETLGVIAEFSSALGGELPDSYWGNTYTSALPSLSAGELRSRPLGEIARTVRESLAGNTPDKVRDEIAFLLAQRGQGHEQRVMPRMPFGAFSTTVQLNNWSKLPLYEVDFGSGTPFWCELPNMPIPWMVHIVPAPEGKSMDVHISMPRQDAAVLTGQEAWQRRLHSHRTPRVSAPGSTHEQSVGAPSDPAAALPEGNG